MLGPFSAQSSPSIIDFVTAPHLLGPHFQGESWNRWRAVLKAAYALPMTTTDYELFAEVAGGRTPPQFPVRIIVLIVGRGGGKDSIAAGVGTFVAATGDFSRLRPGERGTVMCLATDRTQAGIAFSYVRANFEETPLLAPLVEAVTGDGILLKNGAEILVVTNNTRAPRGRTICAVIFDECAHWFGEDYKNPDVEVDAAVTPGLMRFPGSVKIIISSAHRRSGLVYDHFAASFGKDDPDALVVLGTSLQFNPTLDAAEIDRQLALDPEKAGAEYLCRWRDDLTNFLDRQLVEAAIQKGVTIRPREAGVAYTGFADPSGGRGDSFTAGTGHREGNILVVDALYEKRAPFDSDAALDEVAALMKNYGVSTVYGDDYGADLTVAAFRRRGITYRNLRLGDAEGRKGKLNRSEIYLNSVGLFTSGRVKLPDNPRLVHQLIGLERRPARGSGHDSVDHPPAGHDDMANACCGLLVALAGSAASRPIILTADQRRRVAAMGRNRFARDYGAPTRFSARQLGLNRW